MLNQVKKQRHSANLSGSVLLAVVVMTMFVLSLATICLSVVKYTAQATSKNVQRTQAKVTAEAALTEFLNGYKVGVKAEADADGKTVEDSDIYKELSMLAGTDRNHATVYDVGIKGVADDQFAHEFGATKILIYKTTGSGFKIEAETTFSTQTQTASISFATQTQVTNIPTNTIESKKGNVTDHGEIGMGVEGNIYLENDPGSRHVDYVEFSHNGTNSHIYSEMNLYFNTNFACYDVYNKSIENTYTRVNRYFHQAPTITIDGYAWVRNPFTMATEVGKSDTNKANLEYYNLSAGVDVPRASDPAYPDVATYPDGGYSGYDGYLCVYKKLVVNTADSKVKIGTAARPLDIYCHGAYFGPNSTSYDTVAGTIPDPADLTATKSVSFDFAADIDQIEGGFGGKSVRGGGEGAKVELGGNFYCYASGATASTSTALSAEDGTLVLGSENANNVLSVGGDAYIGGDIFLISNNTSSSTGIISVAGDLHVAGGSCIYFVKSGVIVDMISAANLKSTDTDFISHHPYFGAIQSLFRVAGTVDTALNNSSLDADKERNYMPKIGYNASVGDNKDTDVRAKLSKTYELASSNDIFTEDALDGPNAAYAQDISSKYADAMTHTLSDTYEYLPGDRRLVSQKFCKVEASAGLDKTDKIVQINASCKLTAEQSQAIYNGKQNAYVINVTDRDIVIALPININGRSGIDAAKAYSNVGATFRIIMNDPVNNPHFVYFMWYMEGREDECLYLNSKWMAANYNKDPLYSDGATGAPDWRGYDKVDFEQVVTLHTSEGIAYDVKPAQLPVGKIQSKDGNGWITAMTSGRPGDDGIGTCLRGLFIEFRAQNGLKNVQIADYRLANPAPISSSDPDDMTAFANSMIQSFKCKEFLNVDIDNYIMYLIPDYATVSVDAASSGMQTMIQGVLYGWNSQMQFNISSGSRIVGQIKCDCYVFTDHADSNPTVVDLPMGSGSLLGYASAIHGTTTSATDPDSIKIQYFEY